MRTEEHPDRRGRRRLPRRRSDRVEAATTWLLCGLTAAVLVAVAVVGVWVHAAAGDEVRREHGDRLPIRAVALSDVPVIPRDGGAATAYGSVRWTAADGSTRTGTTQVPPLTQAGGEVTVWTDRGGELVDPPLGPEFPLVMTALSVIVALAVGGALVGSGTMVERRMLGRLRSSEWAAEWRQVEPGWSGREGSGRR
ncbi:hypothetical protein [Pseudonocardia sp. N23]|uniref:Rv1733c family protein n=1 Tax=Pseudonocardia sp. N23 TaxID=1987376 RepID=UPI000BFDBC52|nr:hypothetical protein [Pseudonocardia sp. N23]GAY07369.1 putative integral membrane protein [Pseudonocardia sp. N23]